LKKERTGGELVVQMLESLGVLHVFGVPGGQTLGIMDALIDSKIEFVTARHENAAAVMADAYGRLTGQPGVCLATAGPGATNLITGVAGSLKDSSPTLILTCNNRGENINKDDAQNADHVELFRPITKYSRLVAHRSAIKQAMEEAYINAMSGNPGPAHLDFARETLENTEADSIEIPEIHPLTKWVVQAPQPDEKILEQAAELIVAAKRPILWLGNGCNNSEAGQVAIALAELLSIPIVTTFNGIGAVLGTHPLVFGSLSRMGTYLSTRVLADSDLVIAVGNSLNAVSTKRWTFDLPKVLQIDIDPNMLGRYYGEQTFGMLSGAEAALKALSLKINKRTDIDVIKNSKADWIKSLTTEKAVWWGKTKVEDAGKKVPPFSPADIVRALREVAPEDTLLIADAGNPGIWSFLWEIRSKNSYIKPVGFGNMGFGVPAAVAAAVLNPKRPTIVLVGDGSLGMSLAELETLVRVGGRVAVVVFNDNAYGNIRQEQILFFNNRTIGVDLGEVNYAQVAQGLGMEAETITNLEVLVNRVGEVLVGDRPVLFDVPIDPDLSAWTFPPFKSAVS
jgi:acetolactate synthase-1/2/3 large subunit